MNMHIDAEMINLQNKANDAVSIATARGYKLPAVYERAKPLLEAATGVRDSGGPAPRPMPTKAAEVATWIAETARDRTEWQHGQQVASELVDTLTRNAMSAVVQAVPDYLRQLCDEFDEMLPRFRELLNTAPRGVSGQMTPEQFELHAELLRAVESLYAATADRARLALLVDEGEHIGRNPLWLILEPVGSVTIGTVAATLEQFSGDFPRTIEDWAEVDRVGLKVARSGDVARRTRTFATLRLAAANGPDGGMRDKSYDEATRMAGGTAQVLRNLGPNDREFLVEGVAS